MPKVPQRARKADDSCYYHEQPMTKIMNHGKNYFYYSLEMNCGEFFFCKVNNSWSRSGMLKDCCSLFQFNKSQNTSNV